MRRNNPLVVKASDGTFSADMLRVYLASVGKLVSQTPSSLSRAGDRAHTRGETRLGTYFHAKIVEEQGHDQWATRDLDKIDERSGRESKRLPLLVVASSIDDLILFITNIIDEDPALYLAYSLFAEYLIVLLGDEWLQLLEERCGIPRSSMTVIGNHVELDKDHTEQALEQIDDLVHDPSKLPRMREVVQQTIEHFERFCAEVTQVGIGHARDSESTLGEDVRQVSAA